MRRSFRGFLHWNKQLANRPFLVSAFILLVFVVLPLVMALAYGEGFCKRTLIFIIVATTLLIVADVLFRLGYRFYVGSAFMPLPRLPINKVYVEPHPYIPFVNKRNFKSGEGGVANYPLHQGRYFFGQYTTNSMGFFNGPEGDRDIAIPKPDGLFRINCIGASTTGNYIEFEGKTYTYPLELEGILHSSTDVPLEVNNFGQGGYNSADILVRFALQSFDTKPDVVVICHAYNDIRAYLTDGFKPDYSHARKNLAENYWKYSFAGKIPNMPVKFLNFILEQVFPFSVRNSLLDQVAKGEFDISLDPSAGLQTYRRNMKHIIDLCLCNGIQVVLCTYCHFLHEKIRNEALHISHRKIVEKENEIIRNLAESNNLILVDNAVLVPSEEKYFVDSVHFTPDGMHLVAKNIADAILSSDCLAAKS